MKKFAKYIYRTRKNKFCAAVLLGLTGIVAAMENDATAFVFMLIFFAGPLMVAPDNIVA